jgi:hypothetical protein
MEGLLAGMAEARERHGLSSKLILCFLATSTRRRPSPPQARPSPGSTGSRRSGSIPPSSAIRREVRAGLRGGGGARAEAGRPCRRGGAARLCLAGARPAPHRPARPWQPRAGGSGAGRAAGARGMTLTVCPLSNLKLCVVGDMADHPIDRMLARASADDQFRRSGLFRRLCERQLPRRGGGPESRPRRARHAGAQMISCSPVTERMRVVLRPIRSTVPGCWCRSGSCRRGGTACRTGSRAPRTGRRRCPGRRGRWRCRRCRGRRPGGDVDAEIVEDDDAGDREQGDADQQPDDPIAEARCFGPPRRCGGDSRGSARAPRSPPAAPRR